MSMSIYLPDTRELWANFLVVAAGFQESRPTGTDWRPSKLASSYDGNVEAERGL